MSVALARLSNKLLSNKGVSYKQKKAGHEVLFVRRWFCSKEVFTTDDKSAVVGEAGSESKVTTVPVKSRKSVIWNIINRDKDFVPALYDHFPSGLGDAIIQATNNFNKLFKVRPVLKNVGPVKELEDCYKMRYLGVSKEGIKVEVKDGLLMVREDENDFADEKWGWSFGCYEKALVLPKDAKADEIEFEHKDDVLNVVVPKKKDVKELASS